jgi:hypothetical protein
VDAKYASVIPSGDRLSEAQRTRAREILVRHQRMLMQMREFALESNDAPATSLRHRRSSRDRRKTLWLPVSDSGASCGALSGRTGRGIFSMKNASAPS